MSEVYGYRSIKALSIFPYLYSRFLFLLNKPHPSFVWYIASQGRVDNKPAKEEDDEWGFHL